VYQREFDRKIRVGIVGAGSHMYRNLLPALHHLPVELAAVCNRSPEKLNRTVAEYRCAAYTDPEEMYEKERLDGVIISVSPEMHPRLAASLGIADGDFVRVESRRGSVVVRAMVVKTIRPDTVFVPYHWPLDRAANNCTIDAIDPVSKIPEFKICAVRVSRTDPPADALAALEPAAGGVR
jgi:predicted molibdopterin-dependent oxidoreductase YjgC